MIGVYALITLISYCTFSLVELRSRDQQIKQFGRIIQIFCFMFALLLAVASPVYAACPTVCVYPAAGAQFFIGNEANGASVTIQPGDYGTFLITYQNAMTYALNVEQWIVGVDGVVASGMIMHGAGDKPDDMVVSAPDGFFCDPCQITVNEGESGNVTLYPEVGA